MTRIALTKYRVIGAVFLVLMLAGVPGVRAGSDTAPDNYPTGVRTDGDESPDNYLTWRQARLSAALQQVLTTTVAEQPWLPGVMVAIDIPSRGVHWSGAAGVGNLQTGQPLGLKFSFRIASITKTFTAAAIYRLVEQGALDVRESLDQVLDESDLELLESRGYRTDRITVEHLLSHTSGLPDYADTPEYIGEVLANPTRRWTRREQVEFAVDHFPPVGEPGKAYAYSDTGYVLLGEILERRSGLSLADVYRHVLGFRRLRLFSTWLESLEPVPPKAGPRASQYYGDFDILAADPSFDLYGGGGLVSTVEDLNRFITALFAGKVVRRASLASMMTTTVDPYAGRGLFRLGNTGCWGHGGFWGVAMLHCPAEGVSMSVALTAEPGAAGSSFQLFELVGRLWAALDLR
ncbi:MAG: serine hydrolase domain-containing protein [Candidatus Competibacteraceae bacterium]